MTEGKRAGLSAAQRADLWCRWKAGQSLHEIGRALGKEHAVIHFLLARHGGIAPAVRRRSLLALTLAEREDISRGIACGQSISEIAKRGFRKLSKRGLWPAKVREKQQPATTSFNPESKRRIPTN